MLKKVQGIIPVLRINNRQVNQVFFEQGLGMKTHLEEGPFVELGAAEQSSVGLVLMESPSYRTRASQGPKKLHQISIQVTEPREVEGLLARGVAYSQLYKGKQGLGFEVVSPEGDRFLLHAEESVADLEPLLPPHPFVEPEGFTGLTEFKVERVVVNSPDAQSYEAFYQSLFPGQTFLQAREAQGADLLAEAEQVWDLAGLRLSLAADVDLAIFEDSLSQPFFKDRKGRFIQVLDPSGIELWLEK